MPDYNEKLFLKIDKIVDSLEESKICKIIGETLAENIKQDTESSLKGGNSKWEYEYHGSFQTSKVTHYIESDRVVEVDHPAAKRLEYGLKTDLIIEPKNGEALKYIGADGETRFSNKEIIPAKSFKPVGYARRSINKTKKDALKKIKETINGK